LTRNRFLLGDSAGAKEDLEKSLDLVPDYVQSLVKVASVHMEMGMSGSSLGALLLIFVRVLGDAAGAFGDFEAAIRHNANDPDIYYHRGQRECRKI
jgi:import receptor subunit TOM70